MSHFNVSFIVWAKSRDSVHKPQILRRKESRSGSNRGPSAYQPSSSPLGHTGSQHNLWRANLYLTLHTATQVVLYLRQATLPSHSFVAVAQLMEGELVPNTALLTTFTPAVSRYMGAAMFCLA